MNYSTDELLRHIVTEHKTVRWATPEGSVSIRKDNGLFIVRLHDRIYRKRSQTPYKTLQGSLIATDMVRHYYLNEEA